MNDDETMKAKEEALAELDRATAAFRRADKRLEEEREALHKAIVKALRAKVGPSEIERHSPYDRNHIGRIRVAADIPASRPATVKPIKDDAKKAAPKKRTAKGGQS